MRLSVRSTILGAAAILVTTMAVGSAVAFLSLNSVSAHAQDIDANRAVSVGQMAGHGARAA